MWNSIRNWFRDSETLAWARIQTILGIVATIVTYVDPSVLQPVMPAEWFPLLVLANGIFTEYLRRRRDRNL